MSGRLSRTLRIIAVGCLLAATGCGSDSGGHDHDQDHVHVAPRGGRLIELGNHDGNLEILLEADTGRVRMFVLGAHAEYPVRLTEERIQLTLTQPKALDVELVAVASELTGETVGDTSAFEAVVPELVGEKALAGKLGAFVYKGRTFRDTSIEFP